EHLPKMAKVMDKVTLVRSLAHSIPAHGPATVFMTTGNKPTPAMQYPVLGALVTKLIPAEKGVPPFVTFAGKSAGGGAGYLGTAYNPFGVEGAVGIGKGGKVKPGKKAPPPTLRVRGIQLPNGFTLKELDDRDKLLQGFDSTFKGVDKASDLVDGYDT